MAKILIVDDRLTKRQFLLTLLGSFGHDLLEAADTTAALVMVRAQQPDLVITELLTPTVDGYDFTQRLRAEPVIAATRVIFYTAAYRLMEALALAKACGVGTVLTKGSEPEAIIASVNEELGSVAGVSEAAAPVVAVAAGTPELHRIEEKLAEYVDELQTVKHIFDDVSEHVATPLAEPGRMQHLSTRFSENLANLQRLSSRMARLVELTFDVRPERGPDHVIQLFFDTACEMIPSRYAAAGMLDETTLELKGILVSGGIDPDIYQRPSDRAGLLSTLSAQRGTHRVRVQGIDDRIVGLPADHPPVRNFLGASIASESELIGWIYLADKVGDAAFSDEDERIVAAMANAMGRFYGNASLYDLVQRHAAQLSVEATKRREAEEKARLCDRQLAQAQKMEAVGLLSGGIAHDFNNMLSVVVGNLDLQSEALAGQGESVDVRVADLGRQALNAALRGAEVVARLLAFSRKQPLRLSQINIGTVLTGMASLLQSSLGSQVTLEIHCSDDLWSAWVDPAQLETVILNLSINARDAMPGGGALRLHCTNTALDEAAAGAEDLASGDYVALTATDGGSGMPPEILARVFEPFFTTKEEGKGTGLGLPMVYGFARQSGGTVKIRSEVGSGTEVCLYVPRAVGEMPARHAAETTGDAETEQHGERILVVDDNPQVRQMASRLLESLGYEVVEAEGPKAALEILDRGTHIDLLFSDVAMPGGMSGMDLAEEARRRFPEIPIVFTSGFSHEEAVRRSSVALDATIVPKPYRKADLARHLNTALDRVRA